MLKKVSYGLFIVSSATPNNELTKIAQRKFDYGLKIIPLWNISKKI